MSFSVHAGDSITPSTQHVASMPPWLGRQALQQQPQRKVTVCSTFFQTAACPNGFNCGFAHHIQELEPAVQGTLVSMMGEQLPAHFVMTRTAAVAVAEVDHAAEEQRAYNAFFNINPKASSNINNNSNSLLSQNNPTTISGGHLSSSASSSSSQTSAQDSPTLASVTPAVAVPLKRISTGLPPRCQYPHAVPGTFYDFINVKRKCLTEDVEEAYRRWRTAGYKAAKAIDASKADAMDRLIVDAKNVLSNPTIRAEYDSSLPVNPTSLVQPTPSPSSSSIGAGSKVKSIATPAVVPLFEGSIWN